MHDPVTGLDDDARNAVLVRLPFNLTVGGLVPEPGYEDEGMSKEFVMRALTDYNAGDKIDREGVRLAIIAAAALMVHDPEILPWRALETAIVWDRG